MLMTLILLFGGNFPVCICKTWGTMWLGFNSINKNKRFDFMFSGYMKLHTHA